MLASLTRRYLAQRRMWGQVMITTPLLALSMLAMLGLAAAQNPINTTITTPSAQKTNATFAPFMRAEDCQASALLELNQFRALHGVPTMTWNDSLAQAAQIRANEAAANACNATGDTSTAGVSSTLDGLEGVLRSFSVNSTGWRPESCGAGIILMYQLVALYNFSSSTPADDTRGQADIFPRLMWRSTTSIGCAVANGTDLVGDACSALVCYMPSRNLSFVPDKNQAYRNNIISSAISAVWGACKDDSLRSLNQLRARFGIPSTVSWDDGLAAAALVCSVLQPPLFGAEWYYYTQYSGDGYTPSCKELFTYFDSPSHIIYRGGYNYTSATPYETNYNVYDADVFARMVWLNTTRVGCGVTKNRASSCYIGLCVFPERHLPKDNVTEANRLYLANAPSALPPLDACKTAVLQRHNDFRARHGAPAMQWDSDLAVVAQAFAAGSARTGCRSVNSSFGAGREGVTFADLNWTNAIISDPCGPALERIYTAGKLGYNFTTTAQPPAENSIQGQFARLIWKSTKRVGCGGGVNFHTGCAVVACAYPDRFLPVDAAGRKQAYLDNVQAQMSPPTLLPDPVSSPLPRDIQSPAQAPEDKHKAGLPVVIGGVVAGIALLGVLAAAALLWRRRRNDLRSINSSGGAITLLDRKFAQTADSAVPSVPEYQGDYTWILPDASDKKNRRAFLQAGINDVALDNAREESPDGWVCPVQVLTGAQVKEQVKLLAGKPLGTGAQGQVFKCTWDHRFPGAFLAAKVMLSDESHFLKSFSYEAKLLADIRHPNIVRVYGYCLEPPNVCIIMELLQGSVDDQLRLAIAASEKSSSYFGTQGFSSDGVSRGTAGSFGPGAATSSTQGSGADAVAKVAVHASTDNQAGRLAFPSAVSKPLSHLSSHCPDAAPLSMAVVVRIVTDVASGLEYLHDMHLPTSISHADLDEHDDGDNLTIKSPHRAGVLHRDLKPANILLDQNGRAKICDFGIARRVDATVLQTAVEWAGTTSYMAPELLAVRNNKAMRGMVTRKVDVYSLAIIMSELICHSRALLRPDQVLSGIRPLLPTSDAPEWREDCLAALQPCSAELLDKMIGIISACWHHRIETRPTASELKSRLNQLAGGQ